MPEKIVVLGHEFPLLMYCSPYTYQAKSDLIALSMPVKGLMKEADSFHPQLCKRLTASLQQKLVN
jgi:hypothetical protein